MKFVLSGITGMRNRGVEALVRPLVDQLQKQFSSSSVTVLTRTPDYDGRRLCRRDVEYVYDGLTGSGSGLLRRVRKGASRLYPRLAPDFQYCRARVRDADVLVATGGDVFSSDYGGLRRHLMPVQTALDANLPVVFLAHSIGPFKTKEEVDAWLRVVRRAALITTREPLSYRYLTEDLGLSRDLVQETADVAFLLEPEFPTNASSWRRAYRLDDNAPAVAVAPSEGIAKYAALEHEDHLATWLRVITMLVKDLGAQVVIVPHVQDAAAANDDRIVATALMKRLADIGRVTLAGWDHSAAEFKGIISECDLVIAERMHACIAGLGSTVPTVAVGYSVKAAGIMQSLFGETQEEGGVLISVQQFLDHAEACAAIAKTWDRRAQIRRILASQQDRLRQAALSNFSLLSQALSACGLIAAGPAAQEYSPRAALPRSLPARQ